MDAHSPKLGGHEFGCTSPPLRARKWQYLLAHNLNFAGRVTQKIQFLGGRGTRSCIRVHSMGVLVRNLKMWCHTNMCSANQPSSLARIEPRRSAKHFLPRSEFPPYPDPKEMIWLLSGTWAMIVFSGLHGQFATRGSGDVKELNTYYVVNHTRLPTGIHGGC